MDVSSYINNLRPLGQRYKFLNISSFGNVIPTDEGICIENLQPYGDRYKPLLLTCLVMCCVWMIAAASRFYNRYKPFQLATHLVM